MDNSDSLMQFDGVDDTPIDEIDITNDYMFAHVMRDSDICIELLRCLLPNQNISHINYIYTDEYGNSRHEPEAQKTMRANVDMRGVRLDVYLDDGKTVYDVEMQVAPEPYLAKRTRSYQAHIDTHQLKPGEHYDLLKPCFLIFICKFDPFGQGMYGYSFENSCNEIEGLKLGDEVYKLFFNTTGTKGEVSDRLKELLKYMNDSRAYPVHKTSDELIRKINVRVEQSLKNVEWRLAYMVFQVHQRDAELRGERRGEQRGEQRGERKRERQIALNLLAEGLDINLISKTTGLSVTEIMELKKPS